ncbi:uncharacterized protein LOC114260568 [Camellia sinensis]|uniref:uncharacterized protein LOC114260568 n=1 Tax=Camellia sinensis TaxID=4442 RepID=UPI0010360782|nr:uncharacterized protein LOC114260568 [Camellia sinensis]
MTNFYPLSKILNDNHLTGPNYVDWKRNLTIVLTAEKLNHVRTADPPALPWHEGVPTAKDMMVNLKEMFGEQSRSARQIAMKGLMSTKMVEDIDGETKIDVILSSLPDFYN